MGCPHCTSLVGLGEGDFVAVARTLNRPPESTWTSCTTRKGTSGSRVKVQVIAHPDGTPFDSPELFRVAHPTRHQTP